MNCVAKVGSAATLVSALAVGILAAQKAATAAPITADHITAHWSGVIDEIDPIWTGSNIELGDPWTLSIDVDLTAPDTLPSLPSVGIYDTALSNAVLNIGNGDVMYEFSGGVVHSNGSLYVGFDSSDVATGTGLGGTNYFHTVGVSYETINTTTDGLREAFESVINGDSSSGRFLVSGTIANVIDRVIDGSPSYTVPEPSTVVLVGAGLAALLAGALATKRRNG